ncbi:MAG: MFS transporter, partial [Thermomicrobiaceae bacterium]|nr:MFS transporter [Thermomicrobiaceae bacterium]
MSTSRVSTAPAPVEPGALSQWQLAPFHFGAAVGPMGGGVLPIVFAILMRAFGIDRATLSLALPAYMFPYAAMQLVSGGISDLTSRRWSILLGFGGYGVATLLSGLAPTYAVFLAAQVLQGITNAFTTPIALATLGDVVPPRQLGRAIGVMSSINVAGGMVAPLLAGALAGVSWRLVYVAIAGISWLAMAWCALWFRRYGDRVPARRRSHLRADLQALVSVLGVPMLLLASLAFLANAALMGP